MPNGPPAQLQEYQVHGRQHPWQSTHLQHSIEEILAESLHTIRITRQ
jgi:hypothetical protein